MKDEEKFIEQAVDALKQQQTPAGPSDELIQTTSRKIEQIPNQKFYFRFSNAVRELVKIAAVFALVAAGYATGRYVSPQPPDMQQMRSTLEPAIRSQLQDELTESLQTGLVNSYLLLRDELSEQYQQDLNEKTEQIFSVFSAALEQVEQNRIKDTDILGNALVNYAMQTDGQLQLTKQGVVQIAKLLSYDQSRNLIPNEPETNNNSN
jgi:ribosomal protein S19E (S16A)